VANWDEDLAAARPVLEAARAEVLAGTRRFVAGHCNLAIATLPAMAAQHPGLRIAWLDAHPDFNTPETSPSGFLGGMPLAAGCGVWNAGLLDAPLDPTRVHLMGARDIDDGEVELLEAHGVQYDVPPSGPVYVHLDLDVLDNALMPATFPASGGWTWDELTAELASLPDVVGIEVTGCAPGYAAQVLQVLS
jgi:arginase family enzyme